MADRNASADFLTELAKSANEPFHLFELHLDLADGGVVRNSDTHREIVFGGNTYYPNGHLMSFSGIQESAELRVKTVTLQLSGVDQTWVAGVLTKQYLDRQVIIYRGFLTADTDLVVVDPIPIFDGHADAPSIEEDPEAGTCMVTLSAADDWLAFDRLGGRHTNHEEQQLHFPGDLGLQFASVVTQPFPWGRSA